MSGMWLAMSRAENGPAAMRSVPTTAQRRMHVLGALADGEFRVPTVAAWAEVSDQQARADLRWLADAGFARRFENGGRAWWEATAQGQEYIAALSDAEKNW